MLDFENWGPPQYIVLAWAALNLLLLISPHKDADAKEQFSLFFLSLGGWLLFFFLLYLGGFWTPGEG